MVAESSHELLSNRLRQRVLDAGIIGRDLREGILRGGGGDHEPLAEPYGALVRQIGGASYRVTDEQLDAVRVASGSEKAAFEVVMSASIGAGVRRWDAAVHAIEGASDAAS